MSNLRLIIKAIMKPFLIGIICLISAVRLSAQTPSKSYYKKNPVWIEMIQSPTVNYFEAIKAYDLFWEGKEKPLEENDILGESKGAENNTKGKSEKERLRELQKEKDLFQKYGLEVKKFEHWKRMVLPYVQADGSILSMEARLKLWEESKK
jgi:hypothetical protein